MDKLRALLKEMGGSDELVGAIVEELNNYTQSIREQCNAELKQKLTKARALCLEEVNKEKAALARKVGIYLESKQEHFERAAEKQRLNEDTEATNLLKRAKALFEGVSIDDNGQSRDLQVARTQIARLQQAVGTLKEERDLAVKKANRSNEIANDVLQKNRLLENKIKQATVIAENQRGGLSATITESSKKVAVSGKPSVPQRKPRRLDESRRVPNVGVSTKTVETPKPTKTSNGRIANIAASIQD